MGQIRTKHTGAIMVLVLLTLTSCRLVDAINDFTGGGSTDLEEQAQGTLTKIVLLKDPATATMPALFPTPTNTHLPPVNTPPVQGTITGQLSFPSEYIPPLRIVAFDVDDVDKFVMKEVAITDTFTIDVPPGTYYVLAYLLDPDVMDPDFAGAYSQFVLCGLEVGCEDHSLVPVAVQPGETVSGVDLADWYLPIHRSGEWPSNPIHPETGSIRGNLGFPSEYIPPLLVVAFDVSSQDYYFVDTQRNQEEYQMIGLPPGTYHVVAYVRDEGPDFSGGYSYFVTCGQTIDCTDHRLIDVAVLAGEVTEDVNPVDFYAQPGEADWPANPIQ
ncbi:MAG: hypothetical protein U9R53_07105 [Chloroflexota bacterium]|nr:hypothetical protein [Chloroflexota bacterium]